MAPRAAMALTFCRPRVRSQTVSIGGTPAETTSSAPASSASFMAVAPEMLFQSTWMSSPAALPCFSISC